MTKIFLKFCNSRYLQRSPLRSSVPNPALSLVLICAFDSVVCARSLAHSCYLWLKKYAQFQRTVTPFPYLNVIRTFYFQCLMVFHVTDKNKTYAQFLIIPTYTINLTEALFFDKTVENNLSVHTIWLIDYFLTCQK